MLIGSVLIWPGWISVGCGKQNRKYYLQTIHDKFTNANSSLIYLILSLSHITRLDACQNNDACF